MSNGKKSTKLSLEQQIGKAEKKVEQRQSAVDKAAAALTKIYRKQQKEREKLHKQQLKEINKFFSKVDVPARNKLEKAKAKLLSLRQLKEDTEKMQQPETQH